MATCTLALKLLPEGGTHQINAAHVSLAKTSYMAMPNFKDVVKYSLLMSIAC